MRDSSYNTSLLLPCVFVDPPLPDGLRRGLLNGVLISVANVPDISHDPEGTFAEFLLQVDCACAGRACPTGGLGWLMAWEAELTEESVHTYRPLQELIGIVNIQV